VSGSLPKIVRVWEHGWLESRLLMRKEEGRRTGWHAKQGGTAQRRVPAEAVYATQASPLAAMGPQGGAGGQHAIPGAQVVHHLFPNVCHTHYPAIAPIVLDTCREFGIPYHVYPSVRARARAAAGRGAPAGPPGASRQQAEQAEQAERRG